jgi:predicted ATP-binding protein involved in virulence
MFKIDSIHIHAMGGIEELIIPFNPHMNIICGPNGIGKTTILECISQTFTVHANEFLRKKANHDRGFWELKSGKDTFRMDKLNYHPNEGNQYIPGFNVADPFAHEIIPIKTNRNFEYKSLQSIDKDPSNLNTMYLIDGISIDNGKNWFVNRYLWSAHSNAISNTQKHNLEIAKKIFNLIDPQINFSRVTGDTYDILVTQNNNIEIYFEYLSSGYKSVIFILLGIIKEIEHRFSKDNLVVEDFSGVILIDELDLHLHPKWQSNILVVLKELFPNAQFIASTHSAHIIQAAAPFEVIPLGFDSNGETIIRNIPLNPYGFQGWSVEEILTDVMGLEETRSDFFVSKLKQFEAAVENEEAEIAMQTFEILNKLLHPNNHLRKLLKLQLVSLGSELRD